jgi:membrane protease YdiL (CAAX protease family)
MSIGWKRIGWFFALTLLLLLLVPLIHTISGGGALDFDAAAARASAEAGLAWTSNLWVVVYLCLAEPTLWLLVLGSAVPSLAALIVCSWSGRSQIRRLLSRFRPVGSGIPWRRALRSYGLLAAVLPACLLAVYALRSLLPGPDYSQPAGIFGPALAAALLTAAFLDQGAVLEELGWRGYALPELQAGLLSPLGAAVLVGVAWGLWHVPRDVVAGVIDRLGLVQYLLLFLPAFVSGTVTMSIIAAYFVNRSGGSVIPAIMVHGLGNDAVGLSGVGAMDVALSPYHQATKVLPFAVLAVCIVAVSGRRLGIAPRVATVERP